METNIQNIECQSDNKNEETYQIDGAKKTLEFKNTASQYIATLVTNFVLFTIGSFYGFATILIAELNNKDAEIKVSLSELTWLSSQLFLAPIGAIFVGLVAQQIGGRLAMLLGSIFYSTSWALFFFATNSTILLIATALVALTSVLGPGVNYVVEITQPHLRSVLMGTTTFASTLGSLFTVIIASFLYWRTVAFVNFIFSLTGLVAVFFIPDSPYWLASRGKFEEAENALMWLRGWSTPENVKLEFQTLKEAHSIKAKQTYYFDSSSNRLKDKIKPYLQRSFCLPLASVCYVFVIRSFLGSDVVQIFAEVIFEESDTPYAKYMTVGLYSVDILGTMAYMVIVNFFGKRRLMFISLVGSGFTYLTVATSMILIREKYWTGGIYLWIPAISILLSVFITTSGVDSIVMMLNGELFPSKFRDVGAGIGMFVNTASQALVNKAFVYMVEYITLPGVFIFFAFDALVGLVTFYFIIPETEGKTLVEIEEHYAGIKKLESHENTKKKASENKKGQSTPT